MSIVQWLLIILVIAVVALAYWYLRRQSGGDPWHGMEDPAAAEDAIQPGESLGGDSYIVGVRTVSRETPAQRKAAAEALRARQLEAEANQPAEADPGTRRPFEKTFQKAFQKRSTARADQPSPPAVARRNAESGQPVRHAAPATAPGERVDMRAPRSTGEKQQIFQLHVAGIDGRFFDGPDVHAALHAQDLKFGLSDVYHRVTEIHGVTESVFAVANMLKPGTLDPVDQDQLSTPGLTLFLVVPGPLEGRPAMHDMMETANGLAQMLGGEVLDDKRALLKAQTAQFMLDQIADIDRRSKLAHRR